MQGALNIGGNCCLFQMAEILKLSVTQYVLCLEVVLWNTYSEFSKHIINSLLVHLFFNTQVIIIIIIRNHLESDPTFI
jgi:hypothetical protein